MTTMHTAKKRTNLATRLGLDYFILADTRTVCEIAGLTVFHHTDNILAVAHPNGLEAILALGSTTGHAALITIYEDGGMIHRYSYDHLDAPQAAADMIHRLNNPHCIF